MPTTLPPWLRFVLVVALVTGIGRAAHGTEFVPLVVEVTETTASMPPPPASEVMLLEGEEPSPTGLPSRGGRIALEVLGGVGGLFLGTLGGMVIGDVVDGAGAGTKCGPGALCEDTVGAGFLIGGMTGALLGPSLGTWAVGELAGGDGSLGWTFVGNLGGLVIAGALNAVLQTGADTRDAGPPLALLVYLGGGIVGYELSQREPPADEPALGLSLQPWRDGALLRVQAGW